MSAIFNYDWFAGPPFEAQKNDARWRCASKKFPDLGREDAQNDPEYQAFCDELEVRSLIYLRDGFSYEMRELVDLGYRSMLTFECEPLDEQYKVGSFIVSLLFDEIVRVEVFAVHASEKPEDIPLIQGFRHQPAQMPLPGREDVRDPSVAPVDSSAGDES